MDGIAHIIGTAIGWIFFILATFGIALVPFAAWIYLVFSGEKLARQKQSPI
jgi:O-antigen/teichoic acid export membrane protein